jgi:hypothetical protein
MDWIWHRSIDAINLLADSSHQRLENVIIQPKTFGGAAGTADGTIVDLAGFQWASM